MMGNSFISPNPRNPKAKDRAAFFHRCSNSSVLLSFFRLLPDV